MSLGANFCILYLLDTFHTFQNQGFFIISCLSVQKYKLYSPIFYIFPFISLVPKNGLNEKCLKWLTDTQHYQCTILFNVG